MGHHLVGFFKTIQLLGYPHSRKPPKKYISGWWLTYPEKSWTKSQLGWWHSIPNWMESHNPAMFQTTNQGAFIALDWSKGCMKMGRLMNICSPSNGLVSMISCNWVKTMNTSRKKVQYSLEYPSSSWDIEHSQLLWWSMCSNMIYIYICIYIYIYIYIYIWGAVKINCLRLVQKCWLSFFFGGPYRFTVFCANQR